MNKQINILAQQARHVLFAIVPEHLSIANTGSQGGLVYTGEHLSIANTRSQGGLVYTAFTVLIKTQISKGGNQTEREWRASEITIIFIA